MGRCFGACFLPVGHRAIDLARFVFCGECVFGFDFTILEEAVGHLYQIFCLVISPIDIGFPSMRKRRFMLGFKRVRYKLPNWFNPQRAFMHMFAKSVRSTAGDMYFRAPSSSIIKAIEVMALARGLPCRQPHGEPWPWVTVQSSGQCARRRAQRQQHTRKFGEGARHDDVNCDIKHWPPYATIAASMPTLTRASDMFNFARQRSLLPEEALEVMGFPMWPTEGLPYVTPWRDAIDDLSPCAIRSLAGNGMHAAVLAHVLLFALGVAEPVQGRSES